MKRDATGKFVNNWDLETKQRISLSLTNTAWRSIDQEAHKRGISRSEVIEQFARSLDAEHTNSSNEAEAQIALLQNQILEQQQEIATLQRQNEELVARLEQPIEQMAQTTTREVTIILESITDAFVAFDRDWRYTYVNHAAAQILHKTPEELIGKHVWNEVFPELVGGVAYQAMHRAVTEQVPVAWDEFGKAIQRWVEVNAYPSAEGLAVYFRDVTERKQAETERERLLQDLENQQKWLEAVLDLMPTPMVFIEPGTAKVTFSNRIANQLAGGDLPKNKSLDEYVEAYYCTDTTGARIPIDRMPAVLIAQGEKLENYEMNWYTPDGIRSTLCWGEILPAMYGHPAVGICMFQDVTRLKQIEENLRQTEERLQLALSSAQMFAWDTDMQTQQVVCTPNAAEIWGFYTGAAEDFHALIHPEDRQQVAQAVERALTGDQSFFHEYRVMSPDGVTRWLKSQGRAYFNESGRVIRMIGISIDITERKQIEAERDRFLEKEQAARRLAESERQRLRDILMQVPAMFAVLSGPDHVFELANAKFLDVSGRSEDILGKTAREVFPEMAGQGYFELHDHVYQTGEIVRGDEYLSRWDANGDGNLVEGFFNLVFLPLRDLDGHIDSILIHGIEVTAQVQARRQAEALLAELQRKERQQQFLIELNDTIRAIQDSNEIMWHVVSSTGQHFNVTRCTYGEVDSTEEYVIVDRDYCNGVVSVVGRHHMNSFGPDLITELKQGKTVVVHDVNRDPRTTGAGAASFDAIQTQSLLCVPLVKAGRFVALLVLHHAAPRQWTEEDRELMERIAEKTWLAVERSRVEEKLRESEAHLQLAVKIGRMGTWDWDVQIGTMRWSEGHYTVLGLQPNECEPSYEVWERYVHPDDLAEAVAGLRRAMQEKTEYHHEYRMLWSDGSIHWVEARGQFTYDVHGQPKHSIGAVIDITERKQAEQEREQLLARESLARSQAEAAQQQLATIFDTSPIGLALLDAQQCFVAINEALAEINGLSREQHLGASIRDLFGQSDPQLVEIFDQIYTTGEPFISPSFAVNVPGHNDRRPGYYNVYYLPTVNANHWVEGVLIYVVDITERVRLEHAQQFLSEASAVLASSLDYQTTLEKIAQLTVPELADWCTIHIVAEDGAIDQIAVAHIDPAKLEWAHQIREKYPVDPNAARGVAFTLRTGQPDFVPEIPDELLIHAAHDPEHLEILRQVGFSSFMSVPLRTQARIIGAISFISAESGRRYTAADLQFAEELARRASLAIDNAQLYQAAQQDRVKAETANRLKDEFLAVLSHELRSPLNPILGWTSMLRSKRLDATKTEQALETIERNARLQAQLIEDLLDVSRILQGKMTLNVTPVNLATVIEAALETVRLAAEAKHIRIQPILNPMAGSVLGDANRLQQVIWNLLSNAVKFTPSGGQVTIQLKQVGKYAQIQIKDTGKGISPDFLPHVFDYFRQENGTITRQFGGLGLGLAIVRQLTELHGGAVWAESPGQNLGATFTVQLPLNLVGQECSIQAEPLEKTIDLAGVRILVIDDDVDMRELAAFILSQAGAEVTTAASAIQAMALLNETLPDLLLCDIGMPEMDGYSLIRQIRKWSPEQGGSIPAIALTAFAGEINQQKALAAGFQMHISKPINPDDLTRAIAMLLKS
jgi:PAS domain S-box-containing protein